MPFVQYSKDNAKWILTLFRDIQRLLYLPRERYEANKKCYVTRMFVNSFLFGYGILDRWGRDIYSLYTHDLWIHTPYQYSNRSLIEISAEKGERTFSLDKKIFKYLTNRKLEDGMKFHLTVYHLFLADLTWLIRTCEKEQLEAEKEYKKYKNKIEKANESIKSWIAFIPYEIIKKHKQQVDELLKVLSNYELNEYCEFEGSYIFPRTKEKNDDYWELMNCKFFSTEKLKTMDNTINCTDPLHRGNKRAAKKCSFRRCATCCSKLMEDNFNEVCFYHLRQANAKPKKRKTDGSSSNQRKRLKTSNLPISNNLSHNAMNNSTSRCENIIQHQLSFQSSNEFSNSGQSFIFQLSQNQFQKSSIQRCTHNISTVALPSTKIMSLQERSILDIVLGNN